jgi:hypothetical protein
LQKADFWRLKKDNGDGGLDGSTLRVLGYIKGDNSERNPDSVNYIIRWSPNSDLMYCFKLLNQFSETTDKG